VADLVGNTPLVRLWSVTRDLSPAVEIYAKLEYFNPGGSVKDRSALQMMRNALAEGDLGDGEVLLDSTSGNTGVAYSMLGAALGVPIHLVMPQNVSSPRKAISRAFGTKISFSDPLESSDGAIVKAQEMKETAEEQFFYADQYGNLGNPTAHYQTTGPEIWEATRGRVTHFVSGVGTTGTIMGTGRRLKLYNAAVQIVAVEPDDAFHGLEGLKHLPSSLVPAIYEKDDIDALERVETEEGWDMTERLAREEGLLVGYSAGAAMVAALRVGAPLEQGVIVAIFPDHADRYIE
jgi:cysteine synthase B